jgi:hypothetical protein
MVSKKSIKSVFGTGLLIGALFATSALAGCEGEVKPTPTPIVTISPSPTISLTPIPTIKPKPTPSPTPKPTPTPTLSPSPTPTPTLSPTIPPAPPVPPYIPIATESSTPTLSPTPTVTLSPTVCCSVDSYPTYELSRSIQREATQNSIGSYIVLPDERVFRYCCGHEAWIEKYTPSKVVYPTRLCTKECTDIIITQGTAPTKNGNSTYDLYLCCIRGLDTPSTDDDVAIVYLVIH